VRRCACCYKRGARMDADVPAACRCRLLLLSLYTLLCPLIAYLCVARTGSRGRAGAALASGSAETRDAESRRSVARGAVCGAGARGAERPPTATRPGAQNVE
jgi:hypothetical protein